MVGECAAGSLLQVYGACQLPRSVLEAVIRVRGVFEVIDKRRSNWLANGSPTGGTQEPEGA